MALTAIDEIVGAKLASTTASTHQAAASSMAPAASASVPSGGAGQAALVDDAGQHGEGGDRHGGAEEQHRLEAAWPCRRTARDLQQPGRSARPARTATAMPGDRDRGRAAGPAAEELGVEFHPHQEHVEAHAELGADVEDFQRVLGEEPACSAGARSPKSEGPRNTPAIISPTTWGCPTRRASAPTTRQAARMTNICRKKAAESWGRSWCTRFRLR